jgi:hypothetical protein
VGGVPNEKTFIDESSAHVLFRVCLTDQRCQSSARRIICLHWTDVCFMRLLQSLPVWSYFLELKVVGSRSDDDDVVKQMAILVFSGVCGCNHDDSMSPHDCHVP